MIYSLAILAGRYTMSINLVPVKLPIESDWKQADMKTERYRN